MPTTQEQIDANYAETTRQIELADHAIKIFIAVTADAFAEQALPIAKAIGKAQNQASAKLGKDKFDELIAKIKGFASNARATVEKYLYKNTAWYSLTWRGEKRYQKHPRSLSLGAKRGEDENVSHHIIDALNELGKIMADFGFVVTDSTYKEIPSYAVWTRFKWSDAMIDKYEDYRQIFNRLPILDTERIVLFKQKAQEESASLWDTV